MALTYPCDLGDGGPIIWCRDAHQADLIRGCWRAYHYAGPPLDLLATRLILRGMDVRSVSHDARTWLRRGDDVMRSR